MPTAATMAKWDREWQAEFGANDLFAIYADMVERYGSSAVAIATSQRINGHDVNRAVAHARVAGHYANLMIDLLA